MCTVNYVYYDIIKIIFIQNNFNDFVIFFFCFNGQPSKAFVQENPEDVTFLTTLLYTHKYKLCIFLLYINSKK